jgi:hypothetical protein
LLAHSSKIDHLLMGRLCGGKRVDVRPNRKERAPSMTLGNMCEQGVNQQHDPSK